MSVLARAAGGNSSSSLWRVVAGSPSGTNDTTALQAAVSGGGTVVIPDGTWRFTALSLPSNTTLLGGGMGRTTLVPIGTGNSSTPRLLMDTVSNITVRDLTIAESNVTSRTGIYGALSARDSSKLKFVNVEVSSSSSTGIHLLHCDQVEIAGCYVHDVQADGIHVQRGSTSVQIIDTVVRDVGDDAIGFVSHAFNTYGYCRDLTVTGCDVGRQTSGDPGGGIALIGIIGATITGNLIRDTALSGLRILEFSASGEGSCVGGNILVTGNTIRNAGLYTGSPTGLTFDGITIQNQRNVRVANNLIDTTTIGAGIQVSQAVVDVTVQDNTVDRAAGRGIYFSGGTGYTDAMRLTLWSDALLGDGETRSYVAQHRVAAVGNTVTAAGTDGIYVTGSATRYGDTVRIKGNEVYRPNLSNAAGRYGLFVAFCDNPTVSDNYADSSASATALTQRVDVASCTNATVAQNNPPAATAFVERTIFGTRAHGYATAQPTSGTWALGDIVWQSNPITGNIAYWQCSLAGTMGTLNAGATTAATTSGSTTVTVSSATGLASGGYITIAGVTGAKRIVSINATTVVIDTTADATVSAGAVAYRAATFKAGPTLA